MAQPSEDQLRCDTCAYWVQTNNSYLKVSPWAGECRRHAPSAWTVVGNTATPSDPTARPAAGATLVAQGTVKKNLELETETTETSAETTDLEPPLIDLKPPLIDLKPPLGGDIVKPPVSTWPPVYPPPPPDAATLPPLGPLPLPAPPPPVEGGNPGGSPASVALWPSAYAGDWCGDWKPWQSGIR